MKSRGGTAMPVSTISFRSPPAQKLLSPAPVRIAMRQLGSLAPDRPAASAPRRALQGSGPAPQSWPSGRAAHRSGSRPSPGALRVASLSQPCGCCGERQRCATPRFGATGDWWAMMLRYSQLSRPPSQKRVARVEDNSTSGPAVEGTPENTSPAGPLHAAPASPTVSST